jgi:hypothetical protein
MEPLINKSVILMKAAVRTRSPLPFKPIPVARHSANGKRTILNGSVDVRLRPKIALVIGVFMILTGATDAQTLTDLGATAPVPGANDIVQLSAAGNQTGPVGLNYYTDNAVNNPDIGEPGQTFETESSATSYTMNSLAIKTSGLGSYSGIGTAQSYYLQVYSVTGSTATLISTYTSGPIAFNDGDWLQWTGLSVSLAPNASYAYSFGRTSSGTGWEAMAVSSANPYAGGEIGLIPVAGGAISFGSSQSFDAVFDVGLTGCGWQKTRRNRKKQSSSWGRGCFCRLSSGTVPMTPALGAWIETGRGFVVAMPVEKVKCARGLPLGSLPQVVMMQTADQWHLDHLSTLR